MPLPHANVPDLQLGPLTLQPFGLLLLAGLATGALVSRARGRKLGIHPRRFEPLALWCLGVGFVAAHMLDVVFYRPAVLLKEPQELFLLHHGLSSFGGFLGATAAFLLYTRAARLDRWRCADAIAFSFPFGWFFGRLGCAIVHDHPGRVSSSFLAVAKGPAWPDAPRFDLGLLELLWIPVMALAMVLVARARDRAGVYARRTPAPAQPSVPDAQPGAADAQPSAADAQPSAPDTQQTPADAQPARTTGASPALIRRRGLPLAVLLALYAPVRFGLDFLRATPLEGGDERYLMLTPGQWGCLAMLGVVVWLLARRDD